MTRRKRKMVEVVPEQLARVRVLLMKKLGITDPRVAARITEGQVLDIIMNHAAQAMEKDVGD